VAGVVVDAFRAPSCTWCAGNRGIEYRVGPDVDVRAAVSGVVSFAGTVAGTRYLVVRSPDGSRITYGRLRNAHVRSGDRVLAGTAIASAAGEFFLGLRIGDDYVDPAPYIGRLLGRPRLVPIDGSIARPSPTVEPRCGIGVGSRRPPDSIARVDSPGSAAARSDVNTVPLVNTRSPRTMRGAGRRDQPQQGEHHGRHHHAANARSRSALRSPDPALEPEDEAIHLR
jgi:hypothetical protein